MFNVVPTWLWPKSCDTALMLAPDSIDRVAKVCLNWGTPHKKNTCATLLLQAGVNPKIVSERLDHASITLTLDTYSHVLPDMQQTAADKLEGILFNGTENK